MLGKLLKYEIKATARTFLPLYLALIVFAIINNLMSLISTGMDSLPGGLAMILYVIILIGTFVATLVVMIQRFYKSLLSEEGYLMFTLPVKPWAHILSKLLVSAMWTVASVITAIISIIIIALQAVTLNDIIQGISQIWGSAYSLFGNNITILIAQIVIGSIVSLASGILIIYVSISLGHLSNNHKVMASIGSYLGVYTITQIISSLILVLPLSSNFTLMEESAPQGLIWYGIALSAIYAVIYFVITNAILSKKLNLE